MLRRVFVPLLVFACTTAASITSVTTVAVKPAAGATPAACTGTIDITHLAFKPRKVAPGESSTAHLVARNCTRSSVEANVTWVATWVGPASGTYPSGCPVIDPISESADFTPRGKFISEMNYEVPGGCEASGLYLTVRISAESGQITQRSADLKIEQVTPV